MQAGSKHSLLFSYKVQDIKKIVAIAILLLLFFSQSGYQLVYSIRQDEAKDEAKERLLSVLPDSLLESIDATANINDINWQEEGKEFYLHGQLYDVAKTKKINGKTILYCLNDKKEENILQDLSKTVQSGSDQSSDNRSTQHTVKFQLTDFILFATKTTIVNQPARQKHVGYTDKIFYSILEVNTPPPKFNFNT